MLAPSLRRATAADADAIQDLVTVAYQGYTALLGRTPKPMLADYRAAVRDHEVWVLVGADGAIIGTIELVPQADHLWVENVAIRPDEQGRGLGRRLLQHAEAEAHVRDLPAIGLLTNERYTANLAMYQRYGYIETHREPYQGTDLVHFRKTLA
jgi:N-acetylglutamate synthase-like GNAT family acetyltransferase